jgi:hypothetical protein
MLKQTSHFTLAVVLVAMTMLVAGGVAIASNTGFKANLPLARTVTGGTNPEVGNNYLSLPYFNPYINAAGLCTQTGLISTGLSATQIRRIDSNGVVNSAVCGTGAANTLAIVPGTAIIIRNVVQPIIANTPTNIIVVGSHNPTLSVTIPAGTTAVTNLWFSVPFHTTAVTANDLCIQAGMTIGGLQAGQLQVINATTGTPTTVQCGSAAALALNLTLGQAARLRQTAVSGARTFVPAHF